MNSLKTLTTPREFQFMELQLFQPIWSKKHFELCFDDELIATLHWPNWFSNKAIGITAFGKWSFQRKGLFNPRVIIRREGVNWILFEIQMKNYRKGILEMADRILEWKQVDIWGTEMGWIENERDLMLFKISYSLSKKRFAKMRIIKMDFSDEELSVLLLAGLYLINNSARQNGF